MTAGLRAFLTLAGGSSPGGSKGPREGEVFGEPLVVSYCLLPPSWGPCHSGGETEGAWLSAPLPVPLGGRDQLRGPVPGLGGQWSRLSYLALTWGPGTGEESSQPSEDYLSPTAGRQLRCGMYCGSLSHRLGPGAGGVAGPGVNGWVSCIAGLGGRWGWWHPLPGLTACLRLSSPRKDQWLLFAL